MTLAQRDADAVMLSIPADHIVGDGRRFGQTIRRVIKLASQSSQMVTVGLTPYYPATGFGYIRTDGHVRFGRTTGLKVVEFIEKQRESVSSEDEVTTALYDLLYDPSPNIRIQAARELRRGHGSGGRSRRLGLWFHDLDLFRWSFRFARARILGERLLLLAPPRLVIALFRLAHYDRV